METSYLRNHFLIAMPTMQDPNFSRTVTYMCEHNEQGAMGIVINRPLEVMLAEVFGYMGVEPTAPEHANHVVHMGGPVQQDRGFVIHRPLGKWRSSMIITDDVGVSISQDILKAMACGDGPNDVLVALGYAGWGKGQLEYEMRQNAWLSCPADERILFDIPSEQRWQAAADLMGVDMTLLTSTAGHA